MSRKSLVWGIVTAMLILASCSGASHVTPPPTLPPNVEMNQRALEANETAQVEYIKMLDAQRAATQAVADAQRIGAQATAVAMSTRDAIAGMATRQALNEQATRQAQIAGMTTTAQAMSASRTVEAAQYTATANALAVQGTATMQAQSIAGTATMQSVIAQQTQVSASATATANAANAQQTRVSANATATVIVAQTLAAQEKADWDRRLESLRAIASLVGVMLAVIGAMVIVGFGLIRFIDAGVLRARVFRDKTGTVFVIGERDEQGRQMVLIPSRSPGAALSITPPQTTPLLIESSAVDEDTTKRDQAVSLMIAASAGKTKTVDELARELTTSNQIKMVDEPPTQLVSGDVKLLLDGDWSRESSGDGV